LYTFPTFPTFPSLLLGLALLAGCTHGIDLATYPSGPLRPSAIETPGFNIQTLAPGSGTYKHLRVYIEGDGHAWATSSQPSTDPTPYSSLMLRFATTDGTPAAYLARPCQYVTSAACTAQVWTGARFAQPEIDAMNAALSALKRRFGVDTFELVGHSGGGAVALVLAGMRTDVDQVQTLAGNLDPIAWTHLQQLSPLSEPITPLQYSTRLRTIAQRHIVGTRDAVVPAALARQYSTQLHGQCVEIVTVDATHADGYDAPWQHLANQPIQCPGR
jgi:pimeloyl-ACP methyl ester carboxylesterase